MYSRRLPRSGASLALVALGLVFSAALSNATTVLRLDTPTLAQGSSDIVIGSVVSTNSRWNEAHTAILTDVTLRVEETLKGRRTGGTVTLTQMGGDVDGLHLEVGGSPVFRTGQRSVFFLWRDDQGRAQVNGLAQGKFDIVRDRATGRDLVRRDLARLLMVGEHASASSASEEAVPLDEFRTSILRALSSPTKSVEK